MNKNTTLGFLLIFLVVFVFTYLNRPSKEQWEVQKKNQDSISEIQSSTNIIESDSSLSDKDNRVFSDTMKQTKWQDLYGNFETATQGKEQWVTLQNSLMKIRLSTKGGCISSVHLKKYTNHNQEPLYLFEGDESVFGFTFITTKNRVFNSNNFYFKVIAKTDLRTILRLNAGEDKWMDLVYTMHPDDYMVDLKLLPHRLQTELSSSMRTLDIQWSQKIRQQEKGRKSEERYARLTYKFLSDEIGQLRETRNDFKNITNKLKWIGYKDQYFSSVLIAKDHFESTTLESRYIVDGQYIKEYNTVTSLPYSITDSKPVELHFYFGPNDYFLLKKYDKIKLKGQNLELEKLVPLGWSLFRTINKYVVIPIFDWLTSEGINLGLAIFLLTLIIKTALFPLTYQSFISSAKIRILKPQTEVIASKYPGNDNTLIRQQKTMDLYRQVGVNPMAGCLPMLLQLPFSIALLLFFPSAIGLRQQHFLWSSDLSTYDSLIHWETTIPFISRFLGNHISIFCLLMSLVTIINTKFTSDQQSTGQQGQVQGMKLMMYFTPIMMFFFLNSYSAGLNYYYLISTLISILQTFTFRMLLNEKKLLAKLEAHKKRANHTKKKSGLMARLEKIQRQQQASLKEHKKNNRK